MNTQKQKMKMQQKLTPQQLLLMKLLQLPVSRLDQRIKEELEKNPMLELDAAQDRSSDIHDDNVDIDDAYNDEDDGDFRGIDMDEYFDDDYSYRERLEKDPNQSDHRFELSESDSFTESLIRQLNLRPLSDRQRTIGMELIGSIDGSGYLGRDIDLIANDLAFRSNLDVSDKELMEVLHILQSFDPAGVAARNLQECLSLQLHRTENPDADTLLATRIVDKYFDMFSNRRYAALAAQLKVDDEALDRAVEVIRHLNPKPGWGRGTESSGAQYIEPDFIVAREGDQLSFSLSAGNRPRLHLNSDYAEMLQQMSQQKNVSSSEHETIQFIKTKTDAAQWLIDTLEQRQQTLSAIMGAILKYQRRYFLSGDKADLRPMRLKDIAALSHFDESTVSRVVNEKYVQSEFGTFLLKDLFSKALVTDQGEVLAIDHIKEVLQHLVDDEDKSNPMTDEDLTMALSEKGFPLSRRTVSKYRESMGIPVGRLRKELK